MKHLLVAWIVAGAGLLGMGALGAPSALADIEGNCEASINGVPVRGLSDSDPDDAIQVQEGQVIPVEFTSDAGFASHKVKLQATSIGGTAVTVSNETDDGEDSFTDEVNVDDYAWAGAGLYRVSGTATLSDGSTCSGAALVNVDKAITETAAGMIALGATALGVTGLLATNVAAGAEVFSRPKKAEEWVMDEIEKAPDVGRAGSPTTSQDDVAPPDSLWFDLCLFWTLPALVATGLIMVGLLPTGALPGGSAGGVRSIRRVAWKPRISAVGLLGSVLFGLGYVVVLQQSGELFPGMSDFLMYIGIGLVLGVILPSLIRVVAVMRTNRAIASAEVRLNERAGRVTTSSHPEIPAEPPLTPDEATDEGQERSDGG
jgi:hypothetical protein